MNLNLMDTNLIVLAAAAILILAVLAWLYVRKRRNTTADLRHKFGPEYDRAVRVHGLEVSSSAVRTLLAAGDMKRARWMLARPFSVLSTPARGRGICRICPKA